MTHFDTLRNEYPEFVYKSYSITKEVDKLKIKYSFETVGLTSFEPEWTFPIDCDSYICDSALLENLVFSLGMVELISYWKATCSPKVVIKPHGLSEDMIKWWKSLYFGGLGEFFYINGIRTDVDSFMSINAEGQIISAFKGEISLNGNLVPVGGGKDSAVTLRILSPEKNITLPYVINSRGATDYTCDAADYSDTYKVKRTIDKNLIELNKKGFLNGHTPFSAIVAFSSLISAVLNKKKYVVLSNESSANESTVLGEEVNHQFSKGEAFERNFIEYQKEYINSGVEYFSLLRPLSEMQIAALFANYKEYHPIFKSCNAGSKSDIWCCNCPKCLFVYVILSPFLDTESLIKIFGCDLLEKKELLETYKELLGVLPNKPFECVGSRDEVLAASRFTVDKFIAQGRKLPLLLEYFINEVNISHSSVAEYMSFYDENNHLPKQFEVLLKNELEEYLS